MKLLQLRFTVICPDKWTDEQVEETLTKFEVVEERMSQYIRDNTYSISKELRVEND